MRRSTEYRLSVLRLLAALTLAVTACGSWSGGVLAAQDDSSHEFAGGEVLEWGGRWEIEPDFTFIDGDLELVSLSTGSANFHVMAMPSGTSKNEIRDAFLDGFLGEVDDPVTIDRGDYGAVSYSLDFFSTEGIQFGGFMLIREGASGGDTFAYFVVTPVETMSETISDIQGEFTLDGTGFFEGIDGQGLEDQLLNAADGGTESEEETDEPSNGRDDPTPEATEEEDEEGSGSGNKFGGSDDEETPEAEDETPEAEETPEDEDSGSSDETGLIEDGLFIGPYTGAEITWGASWELNPGSEDPLILDEHNKADGVLLSWTGEELAFMTIFTLSDQGEGVVEAQVEYWESAEGMATLLSPSEAEVIASNSTETVGWVLYQDYFEGDNGVVELFVIKEIHYDPETGLATTFSMNSPNAHAAITVAAATSEIEVDGRPPFEQVTIE